MNNLTLINTDNFNGISCDVYGDGNKIFMTRRQIGEALGYDSPNDSVRRIHERHRDRLDKYSMRVGQTDLPSVKLTYPNDSVTVSLTTAENDQYAYLYNQRGIMEICRWSRQPLADKFMDFCWDIIEAYRDGTLTVPHSNNTSLSVEAVETMVDNRIQYITKGLSDRIQELQEQIDGMTVYRDSKKTTITGTHTDTRQDTHQDETDGSISGEMSQVLAKCGFDGFDDMKRKLVKQIRKSPEEIIKETIEPLAKLYDDRTLGYTYTYHKVYSGMDVSWKHRLGRYRNKNRVKRNPSKSKLIAGDPKLLRMFVDVVNQLIEEQEQAATV